MATSAIHDLVHKQGQRLSTLRLLLLLSVNNADKGVKPAAFDKRLAMMWAFATDVQQSVRGGAESTSRDTDGEGEESSEVEDLSVDIGLATAPYFHEKSAALADGGFYRGDGDTDGTGETEQVFLVGYDTLVRIFNPKYYGSPESIDQAARSGTTPMQEALGPFFGRAKLRVTMRTGDEWGGADEQTAYLADLLQGDGLGKVGGNKDWGRRVEMIEGREVGADIISSTYARVAAKDRDSDRLNLTVTPGVRWWIEQEGLYTE
jgi:nicotinamide-nucleotide adenylyltransferase